MELNVEDMIKWLGLANEKIQENKVYLTKLDQPIGDGDHGINMARGYQEAVLALQAKEYNAPFEVLKDASMVLLSKVGGASGPLYGTAFLKLSMEVKVKEVLNLQDLANGLEAGLTGLKQRGKSEIGEKTLIDVWGPVVDYFHKAGFQPDDLTESARKAMENTKDIIATKGRAAYFKEKSIGHIDPGSASSYLIFEALAEVIKEKE
ncbi:dihydroxyacetone kinase subunit L [Ornithinibacillus massiliensis]|uniref:Dihydroxyacetone kinase subunit L n=1 Tax=Ornithinibacillus massiliensis TaxID=1944633 RepID=A0ABS5MID0_9BACI|nr:dihydroxyacetone kinase subunit DhaL [Ornithinibacillus massiliensis]MBS3681617.1 dihydroxyacetone kinase subunit L [Ornithinibacillus massiliensis]